jgi:tRNA dimethylallyltransferase
VSLSEAPLLCIMGPTASGKTDLAIRLAEATGGELISVDSALVYRGLDIGAAKPAYPHHLVDICDASEAYSAARFARDASAAIERISARGRRPILAGGTMLYFRALIEGLDPLPEADAALRAELEERARREGWPALHAELGRRDPVAAARIHPNHSQRILRALEVCILTGSPLSETQRGPAAAGSTRDALCFALAPEHRGVLHDRIARRFHAMLDAGFLDEVRALYGREDLHPGLPALRCVGYRQLWSHLDGHVGLDEAVSRGIAATRQLAKRQYTWLRKWPGLRWILVDEAGRVSRLEGEFGPLGDVRGAMPSDVLLNYLRTIAMV